MKCVCVAQHVFIPGPPRQYEGGWVDHVDYVDPDRFNLIVIADLLKDIGYAGVESCSYVLLGQNMDNGLVMLITDDDAMEMVSKYKGQLEIDIYVEHPINTPTFVDSEVEALENETHIRSESDNSEEEVFRASSDDDSEDDDSVLGGGVDHFTDSSSEEYDSAEDEAYKIDPHETEFDSEDENCDATKRQQDKNKTTRPSMVEGMDEGRPENESEGIEEELGEGNERNDTATGHIVHGEGSSRVLTSNDGIYINPYEDDVYLSEELHTLEGSEDEGKEKTRWPQFNPNVGYGHVRFKLGMEFANLDQFREVVRDYAIHKGKCAKLEDYVSIFYSRDVYLRTYEDFIHPINGDNHLEKTQKDPQLPPIFTRPVGRPKGKRKPEQNEVENPYKMKRRMSASKCGAAGHNTCTYKGLPKNKVDSSKVQGVKESLQGKIARRKLLPMKQVCHNLML
ncbi:hypothetical protein L6164_028605 [Bauhinia variegata]|uniref:Uncharacterized protein n=1 Tax=Bauhinia variegata TaxID=167791 RepID=A0ACB9L6A3_BAUVA|nr:hypothetical protein L6164_028605 [Bauhinia variegata]